MAELLAVQREMECLRRHRMIFRRRMDHQQPVGLAGFLLGRAELEQQHAEALPFSGAQFDAYTIAFNIRNVPRIETRTQL